MEDSALRAVCARKAADGVERLYGRGTADDKGQLMTFLEAARAWIATTGSLPVNATFLLEGEEESGSPSLVPFLKANKEELSPTPPSSATPIMWDAKTPAITTRLRGLVHDEVTITGPRIDLHSGAYGGPAMNPIRVLAKVLAALHDKNGKVTIPGFYDGVERTAEGDARRNGGRSNSPIAKFLREVGLSVPAGEKGKSVLEQIWARPTAEVNGILGGYTGAGTKTVLPSKASAKLTFRLVGKQKPEEDPQSLPQIREGARSEGLQGRIFRKRRRQSRLRGRTRTIPSSPDRRRRSEHEFGKRRGADGLGRLDPDRRAASRIFSAWTACSSASVSTTMRSTAPTRNTISQAFTAASAAGSASWRRIARDVRRARSP